MTLLLISGVIADSTLFDALDGALVVKTALDEGATTEEMAGAIGDLADKPAASRLTSNTSC